MPGRSNEWTHPSHGRPLLPHHQLGLPAAFTVSSDRPGSPGFRSNRPPTPGRERSASPAWGCLLDPNLS
jgi:hypothetical protein